MGKGEKLYYVIEENISKTKSHGIKYIRSHGHVYPYEECPSVEYGYKDFHKAELEYQKCVKYYKDALLYGGAVNRASFYIDLLCPQD